MDRDAARMVHGGGLLKGGNRCLLLKGNDSLGKYPVDLAGFWAINIDFARGGTGLLQRTNGSMRYPGTDVECLGRR